MNCIEFESAIELAIEKHELLDHAILEHAKSCPDCQTIWDMHQRLDAAITSWRIVEPPIGFADAVLQELTNPRRSDEFDDQPILRDFQSVFHGDQPVSSRDAQFSNPVVAAKKPTSSGVAIAAMSACLLFATSFVFEMSRPRSFPIAQRLKHDTAMDLPGTLTAVLSDLKTEYRGMAIETTSAAREMVNAIPHPETVAVLPQTERFQLNQAPDEMVRIWKPIESQVGSALGFLWKAVPSEIPSG